MSIFLQMPLKKLYSGTGNKTYLLVLLKKEKLTVLLVIIILYKCLYAYGIKISTEALVYLYNVT